MDHERFFKGWAKPGPDLPGTSKLLQAEEGETLDALSGSYRIFQLRNGHRFSTDDLLTAWYGTIGCPSAARALDLGSGIGSVAMVAAWRLSGAQFVTVEAQEVSVKLARKSASYNGLSSRFDIREGDFRESGVIREDENFDLILGSPPYFPLDGGMHGDHPQKIACRFEARGDILDYCQTAARHLSWGGYFACVFPMSPPHQEERLLRAAEKSGLTIIRRRPVVLKDGEAPLLSLYGMTRSDHLPVSFRARCFAEPPLVIRTAEGEIHPEYSIVKLSIGFPP